LAASIVIGILDFHFMSGPFGALCFFVFWCYCV